MPDDRTGSPRKAVDIGILVTDMERSLHFYRDLLELPVVGEIRTTLIGPGRLVQLQYGASLIKLTQMDQSPSVSSPEGLTSAYGYRYLTLLVSDIDAMMCRLEQGGVAVAIPVTVLGHGARIAMVEDPDGNIVEFVQEA